MLQLEKSGPVEIKYKIDNGVIKDVVVIDILAGRGWPVEVE